jgi:nucleotide-binding universal stress UspA family protein
MKKIRPSKYLVCVDDTEVSRMALRFACIKGKARGIRIDVLHVIETQDVQTIGAIADKMAQEQRAHAEAFLSELAEEAHRVAGIIPSLWIREGNPSDEILELAMEEPDINMLVLGVNPGSKSGNRVINWVSSKAGDKLLVPVMLVPSTLTDQQMQELA